MDTITVVILVLVLLLAASFVFYKKVVNVSVVFLRVIFPISIIAILSVLFLPQLYLSFVQSNFENTPLAANLKSVDTTLTQVTRVQNNIINTVQGFFNSGTAEVTEYTSNVYGQVVDMLANILRLLILTISFIVLVFLVYIRYAFSGIFEAQYLEKRVKHLEKELEILKKSALNQ